MFVRGLGEGAVGKEYVLVVVVVVVVDSQEGDDVIMRNPGK